MGPYADPPGSRAGWSQRELWAQRASGRPSSLTCSSTLEASSLQHLLVLLLSHALAALLNKRSHGGATVAARGSLVRNELLAAADRGDRDRWKRKSSGAGTRTPNDWTKTSRVANYTTPER